MASWRRFAEPSAPASMARISTQGKGPKSPRELAPPRRSAWDGRRFSEPGARQVLRPDCLQHQHARSILSGREGAKAPGSAFDWGCVLTFIPYASWRQQGRRLTRKNAAAFYADVSVSVLVGYLCAIRPAAPPGVSNSWFSSTDAQEEGTSVPPSSDKRPSKATNVGFRTIFPASRHSPWAKCDD